ncbi:phosphatase PAP2 family protein [Microbacterium sp. CFH 90308]|uniref:Phosphatase PAP2 family protein n=1 Tax=Microbacterium salsuginis TaxID=2722803 RepID=A0ABX1KDT2_9MICO|nr:phosphatase PAP2 family protein [Microbacterium sp. CFH 90308]
MRAPSSFASFRFSAVALVLMLCAAVVLPFPGSLSVVVTRALSSFASAPGIEVASDGGLILLAAATVQAVAFAWVRRPVDRPALLAGVFGVVLAYGFSESLKLVFAQARPCTVWVTGGECPPAGDWSLPSNHATLAFGAVVVLAVATRSLWLAGAALVVAFAVAAGRVLQGVHYSHDVAIGALLGLGTVLALVWFARSRQLRRLDSDAH